MDKVLIVEDNPVLLKILETCLKKYEQKFISITARDGQEAIDILKTTQISLLVTDLQMPKVDGLSLLAHMNDHHPEIQCIVMSAHGTPQLKEKISLDVLRFIEKPFEIDELVQTILPTLERDEPAGHLNGISIANFLQMIHMERKTCLLEIETPDGQKGYIYFEEGVLFDAVYGPHTGEAAALEIIPHDRVKIRFKNLARGRKKVNRRIQKDLAAVLVDSMRRKDETEPVLPAEEESLLDNLEELDEDFELLDMDGELDPEAGEDETPDQAIELDEKVHPKLALDDDPSIQPAGEAEEPVDSELAPEEDDEPEPVIDLQEEVAPDLVLDEDEPPGPTLVLDKDEPPGPTLALDKDEPPGPTLALDEDEPPSPTLALDEDEMPDTTFDLDEDESEDLDLAFDDDLSDLDLEFDGEEAIAGETEEPQTLHESGTAEELIL